jgi:hypothetical protein
MFEPVNALEALMQSATSNPAKIPDFYRALLDSELYILTPEAELELGRRRSLKPHEAINVATVGFQGKQWHPAFTAPERVSAYVKEPAEGRRADLRSAAAWSLPPSRSHVRSRPGRRNFCRAQRDIHHGLRGARHASLG